jgi:hypothetical protein
MTNHGPKRATRSPTDASVAPLIRTYYIRGTRARPQGRRPPITLFFSAIIHPPIASVHTPLQMHACMLVSLSPPSVLAPAHLYRVVGRRMHAMSPLRNACADARFG